MKELTQRRNLDLKNIIKKIKSDGMAEIDNFLDEDTVEKLQIYIFEEINNQPKGVYFLEIKMSTISINKKIILQ